MATAIRVSIKDENIYNGLVAPTDRALSVILSKAFLLAEDDKITDKTINSQIRIL